jgi:hypothetical protein
MTKHTSTNIVSLRDRIDALDDRVDPNDRLGEIHMVVGETEAGDPVTIDGEVLKGDTVLVADFTEDTE